MKKIIKNYDLTKVLKAEHGGKWVALNPERTRVLAFDEDLEVLEQKVGIQDVVFMRALPQGVSFSFFC